MNEDFEFDEGFDFDDESLADEIGDLEDSIDDAPDVMLRTAILQKDRMTALLCIKSATAAGAAICRVDPREAFPAVQLYEDRDAAMLWFSRSLRSSRKNGWNVVYDGLPLEG